MLVFSDGFDESQSAEGALLGEVNALDVFSKTSGQSPEATVAQIMEAICSFAGEAPQFDDITLLAFEAAPEGAESEGAAPTTAPQEPVT